MVKNFEISAEQIQIKEVLRNKSFFEIELYAISNEDPNRNKCCFTLESMEKGIEGFTDKPIVGFFNMDQDFESHNGREAIDRELGMEYWDNSLGEQILGFIREKDTKKIIEKDGLSWIYCTAMIYTNYNFKQAKKLLTDKTKKVSVEVDVLKSETIGDIEYIYEFELRGITILGSKNGVEIREGIEGAHLSILDKIGQEVYNTQRQALTFAYKEFETQKSEAIEVDKSIKEMSKIAWRRVDKTALAHKVVAASNFKTIAKDIYLELAEGWEEGEVTKLKYPVMQIEGNKAVYNREGLAAAKAYATKYKNTAVLSKLKTIYKDLGLEENNTYDLSKAEHYAFYSSLYEISNEASNNENIKKGEKTMEEMAKLQEQYEALVMEKTELETKHAEAETKYAELEAKHIELEAKCAEAETKCAETEIKCAEAEEKISLFKEVEKQFEATKEEVKQLKIEKQSNELFALTATMKLSEEDVAEVSSKLKEGHFMSTEEMEKDLSYIAYKKGISFEATPETEPETAPEPESKPKKDFGFKAPINPQTNSAESKNDEDVFERLEKKIK